MIENIKGLTVKYNNRVVGYLRDVEDGQIAFQYDEDWIKSGFSISPFSLPLSNEVYISKKLTFDGLFGVFWDSLPDGWGELLIRRLLTKKGINPDKLTPLQKLALVRDNGLGALTYEPHRELEKTDYEFDLDELAEESQKILNDDIDNADLDMIYGLGGSSGGARPKAHIKVNNEEWIVKFPCLIDPRNIGELEFNANKLAKECGLNVNEFKLFNSKVCSGYFVTKRFDRKDNKKIHMISLSALLETTHKIANLDYHHFLQVVQTICRPEEMYEAFRRMCFNVFYKNKDDHGKNFSFLYDEELKSYKLSPAYDITSTPTKFEHEMTANGNGNPTEEDLLFIAKHFKLSITKCKQIIEEIKNKLKI